jgi:hypothetical protein
MVLSLIKECWKVWKENGKAVKGMKALPALRGV